MFASRGARLCFARARARSLALALPLPTGMRLCCGSAAACSLGALARRAGSRRALVAMAQQSPHPVRGARGVLCMLRGCARQSQCCALAGAARALVPGPCAVCSPPSARLMRGTADTHAASRAGVWPRGGHGRALHRGHEEAAGQQARRPVPGSGHRALGAATGRHGGSCLRPVRPGSQLLW